MSNLRTEINRRQFLVSAGVATTALACGPMSGALVGGALVAVSHFLGKAGATLAELWDEAIETFDNQHFAPGQIVKAGRGRAAIEVEGAVIKALASYQERVDLKTPVIGLSLGTARRDIVQIGHQHHALVQGWDRAHLVHQAWLSWTLTKDNCDLAFDGNTVYEPCGINGCPIEEAKQVFRYPSGTQESLSLIRGDLEFYPEAVRTEHQRHSPNFKGCGIPVQVPCDKPS